MSLTGVALEGGGARGSYQAGSVKALLENGYDIRGYVGTSIGSINCALLAQNDMDILLDLWNTIETSTLFDVDDDTVKYLVNMRFDKLDMSKIYFTLSKVIKDKGADTSKIRKLLYEIIDEERLRRSEIDFGLVTVSLPDFRPLELMLDDIPKGKVIDYIMASSCFPGFRSVEIGTKHYIDGGFYDNMPINMLAKRGYDKIFGIRTISPGVQRKLEYGGVDVTVIKPSDSLGLLMLFSPEQAKINIQLGYYDTQKAIKKLGGRKYYVNKPNEAEAFSIISGFSNKVIQGIAKPLNINAAPSRRLMFEKVVPLLAQKLKVSISSGYSDIIIAVLEFAALEWKLPRFKEYTFEEFCYSVRRAIQTSPLNKSKMIPLMTSVLRFIAALPETTRAD